MKIYYFHFYVQSILSRWKYNLHENLMNGKLKTLQLNNLHFTRRLLFTDFEFNISVWVGSFLVLLGTQFPNSERCRWLIQLRKARFKGTLKYKINEFEYYSSRGEAYWLCLHCFVSSFESFSGRFFCDHRRAKSVLTFIHCIQVRYVYFYETRCLSLCTVCFHSNLCLKMHAV